MAVKQQIHSKSGVASFYIVAISTLVLVILATSFATAILSEIIRSSNDDLAQSAYDSAMAGVEEAKLAYINYRNCINVDQSLITTSTSLDSSTDEVTCRDIVYWVEHPDCDMVAHILGRIGKTGKTGKQDEIGEVSLEQTTTGKTSDLDQAYTCVEIYTDPSNIYGTLNIANPYKIAKVKTEVAAKVKSIMLSWHMNEGDLAFNYSNIVDNQVAFGPVNKIETPTPATISFQIVQTPNTGFTFNQLNGFSAGGTTNRATMFFVPTDDKDLAKSSNAVTGSSTYVGIYDEPTDDRVSANYLSASQIASTNNQDKNYPYLVYCDRNKINDFACSVEIELPKPIDGNKRSNEVFAFIVSSPYSNSPVTYTIDFFCQLVSSSDTTSNNSCKFTNEYGNDGSTTAIDTTQVVIDSTGRAGDMFKRVEVRLDTEVSANINGYPFYAIQADTINKNISTNNEWGIEDAPAPAPEPEPNCTASTPYMQNWNDSASLAVNSTIYLRDSRDNECYSVAKLLDGKVWMTTNLNLGSSSPMRLTSADTNLNNGLSTYTLPASSGSYSDYYDNKPITQSIYKSGNATGDCQTERCYTYYTYTAATAGTDPLASGDATSDICPKGWKIPSLDEARTLNTTNYYSGPRPEPFPSFVSERYSIFYWLSSTFYYSSADHTKNYPCEQDGVCDRAFFMAFTSEQIQSGYGGAPKSYEYPILCIKK